MPFDLPDRYDEAYEAAEVGYEPVPEGEYQVKVVSITPKQPENATDPLVEWKFRVVTGPMEGRTITMTNWLNEKGMSFLKRNFQKVNLSGSLKAILSDDAELARRAGYVLVVSVKPTSGRTMDKDGNLKMYTNITRFVSRDTVDPSIIGKVVEEGSTEVPF